MTEIKQLSQERQRLIQDFLTVKTELAKVKEENERLKKHNKQLSIELEESEMHYDNLFAHVQASEIS